MNVGKVCIMSKAIMEDSGRTLNENTCQLPIPDYNWINLTVYFRSRKYNNLWTIYELYIPAKCIVPTQTEGLVAISIFDN